jgi:N-glycosylase/DNA lyase
VKKLIRQLKALNIEIAVKEKLKEFERGYLLSAEEKFVELCFCLLVANAGLESTLKIWKIIGKNFLTLKKRELAERLKKLGYRFYNKRAEYIVEARKRVKDIERWLVDPESGIPTTSRHSSAQGRNDNLHMRAWLVENVKGIGWKEASHFLRNMGFFDFAILDRHILKILARYKIIDAVPKTLIKKKYLEIENRLEEVARRAGLTMAELDIYLFYLDSGRLCSK